MNLLELSGIEWNLLMDCIAEYCLRQFENLIFIVLFQLKYCLRMLWELEGIAILAQRLTLFDKMIISYFSSSKIPLFYILFYFIVSKLFTLFSHMILIEVLLECHYYAAYSDIESSVLVLNNFSSVVELINLFIYNIRWWIFFFYNKYRENVSR